MIGINSAIESGGQSEGNVGIGFAVPIDTAQEIAQQLIDHGSVEHAFVGISGADLTPEIADVLNLNANGGALVQSVVPDSPADKAGIEAGDATVTVNGQRIRAGGDVITGVDGHPISGMNDVIAAVDSKKPGDSIQLTLLRGGDTRTVTVTLAANGLRERADITPNNRGSSPLRGPPSADGPAIRRPVLRSGRRRLDGVRCRQPP